MTISKNVRLAAERLIAATQWEVAMYLPVIRVRVEANNEADARRKAISLPPQRYADAVIARMQYTKPKLGDVVGVHPRQPAWEMEEA